MRNYILIIFLGLVLHLNSYGQATFVDPFDYIASTCNISESFLSKECPDIPLLSSGGTFNSQEEFAKSYRNWIKTHQDQFNTFERACSESGHNYSWISMGIMPAIAPVLPDSLKQGYPYLLYEVLGYDYNKVKELAPNFPSYTNTGNYVKDSLNFEKRYLDWSAAHPREVENILNGPEYMALLGDDWIKTELGEPYDGEEYHEGHDHAEEYSLDAEANGPYELPSLPDFLYAKIESSRPTNLTSKEQIRLKETTAEAIEELQKWLWVYQPDEYNDWFGDLTLPYNFNSKQFRADAIAGYNPNPDGYVYKFGTSGDLLGPSSAEHYDADEGLPDFLFETIALEEPHFNSPEDLKKLSKEELHKFKKWLFLFDPDSFRDMFMQLPELPEAFNLDKYRQDVQLGKDPDANNEAYFTH